MKKNISNDSFWPSYVDVMTNLFAITLVLFVISFFWFKWNTKELEEKNQQLKVMEEEYLQIQELNRALQSLNDNPDFQYSREFQKHILQRKVEFKPNQYQIPEGLKYIKSADTLLWVGENLLKTIVELRKEYIDESNAPFRIKFLIIIEGQASRSGKEYENYLLSYQRALSLKQHWENISFDQKNFSSKELNCEVVVSGSGWYGAPREPDFHPNRKVNEANQRFLVHIVPVIDWKDRKIQEEEIKLS